MTINEVLGVFLFLLYDKDVEQAQNSSIGDKNHWIAPWNKLFEIVHNKRFDAEKDSVEFLYWDALLSILFAYRLKLTIGDIMFRSCPPETKISFKNLNEWAKREVKGIEFKLNKRGY